MEKIWGKIENNYCEISLEIFRIRDTIVKKFTPIMETNTQTSIRVSGNIIRELSSKIPTNFVALNELIKNSYDAFAETVTIHLDPISRKLTIRDDGSGMDRNDVNELFHLADSHKKYGTPIKYKNKNNKDRLRYTQGAKGLGFLAALKFGNKITWKTKKDVGIQFCIADKSKLIDLDNISSHDIKISNIDLEKNGTIIEIEEVEEYYFEALKSYFEGIGEREGQKIANAFYKEAIEMSFSCGEKKFKNKSLKDFKNILKRRQLLYVEYSSKNECINFYRKKELCKTIDYKKPKEDFEVELEILIYDFGHNPKDKKEIDSLFLSKNGELRPLIYINDNLFDNENLFDPNINRSKRSSESLPQMIGYVKIFCENPRIEFNSDRTQFVQNDITDAIEEFLKNINSKIQKIGSQIKIEAKANEPNITGPSIPDPAEDETSSGTARIILRNDGEVSEYIPSPQINLYNYIVLKKNSSGEDINNEDINITIESDNFDITDSTNIIPSITRPCSYDILYSYTDKKTGNITAKLFIDFIEKESPIKGGNGPKNLIRISSTDGYKLSIPILSDIINQINYAYKSKENKYKELIACSLRSAFELCLDHAIRKKRVLFADNTRNIEDRVYCLFEFFKSSDSLLTIIDKVTNIGFNNLKNSLVPENAYNCIKNCHLGAHRSSSYLTNSMIQDAGKVLGLFCVCINEFVLNVSIPQARLEKK